MMDNVQICHNTEYLEVLLILIPKHSGFKCDAFYKGAEALRIFTRNVLKQRNCTLLCAVESVVLPPPTFKQHCLEEDTCRLLLKTDGLVSRLLKGVGEGLLWVACNCYLRLYTFLL
jgi:hypothetical protein